MTEQQQRSEYQPGDQSPAVEADRPEMDRAAGDKSAGANGGQYAGRQGELTRGDRAGDFHGAQTAAAPGSGQRGGAPQATDPGLDRFQERWPSVQGAFVDDPKGAVEEADRLVAEVIQSLERGLTQSREQVQGAWTHGEPDTEQLRQSLHGYRALFQRLVDSRI